MAKKMEITFSALGCRMQGKENLLFGIWVKGLRFGV